MGVRSFTLVHATAACAMPYVCVYILYYLYVYIYICYSYCTNGHKKRKHVVRRGVAPPLPLLTPFVRFLSDHFTYASHACMRNDTPASVRHHRRIHEDDLLRQRKSSVKVDRNVVYYTTYTLVA